MIGRRELLVGSTAMLLACGRLATPTPTPVPPTPTPRPRPSATPTLPASKGWARRAPLPTARFGLAVVALGGKIYAIGGHTGGEAVATVEEYDPASDRWRSRAPLISPRFELAAAVANGRIYAVGGRTEKEGVAKDVPWVDEYDPAADKWRAKAVMTKARARLGAALAGNGKLYAYGGRDSDDALAYLTSLLEYDPKADEWTPRSTGRGGRDNLGVVATEDGKVLAIGGSVVGSSPGEVYPPAAIEQYDPATDSWTRRANMPTPRLGLAVARGPAGLVYALGGFDGVEGVATNEVYDPKKDAWTVKSPMPTPRAQLGAATGPNGRIYAVGGEDRYEGTAVPAVEEYDPAVDA